MCMSPLASLRYYIDTTSYVWGNHLHMAVSYQSSNCGVYVALTLIFAVLLRELCCNV